MIDFDDLFTATLSLSFLIYVLVVDLFLENVQDKFISFDNPTGIINNSDLEFCGNIAHHDVVAQLADILEQTIATLLDNIVNVYWLQKGSTATTGPQACLLAYMQITNSFNYIFPFMTILQDQ